MTLKLAWRNLWRHARRTWLTVAAMVFSGTLLIFMISLQVGMYAVMIENTLSAFTGHVQIQHPEFLDKRSIRDVVPDIEHLARQLRTELAQAQDSTSAAENRKPAAPVSIAARAEIFALASSRERSYGIQILGVQADRESGVSTLPGLVRKGRYLKPDDDNAVVIGAALARNLRIDVGDELTLIGSGRDGSFAATIVTVVGLFDSGIGALDRSFAQMPLAAFQDTFMMGTAGHALVIKGADSGQAQALSARIGTLLTPTSDLAVLDWEVLQPGLKQSIQADMGSAFFMYGILVILVAFSVLNTQLMSVLERTREFGTVMALGLKPARLGRVIITEAALMGMLGIAISLGLGATVTTWVGQVGFSIPGMEEMAARFNLPPRMYPTLTPFTLVIGPLVIFVFSILSSAYPAMRLFRMHPIEAMRSAQ